jgi:hypothetical protein
VVAPGFLVVVDTNADQDTIEGLWALAVGAHPSVETVVGAIPVVGPSAVESFGIVWFPEPGSTEAADRRVTAVVRGEVSVDVFSVGGSRRFDAQGAQPWVLAEFRSVVAVELGAEAAAEPGPQLVAGALPILGGVATVATLSWSISAHVEHGPLIAAAPSASPAAPASIDPAEATILVPPAAEPMAAIAAQHESVQQESAQGDTILVRPESPSLNAPLASEAVPVVPPTAVKPAHRFAARIGADVPIRLDTPVIFGRNPSLPRVAQSVAPLLITVASPYALVSSSHVSLVQEGDTVVVTDLGSTNGTFLGIPGRAWQRMRAHESFVVLPGALLDIGDGNIIEIMLADGDHTVGSSAHSTVRGPV